MDKIVGRIVLVFILILTIIVCLSAQEPTLESVVTTVLNPPVKVLGTIAEVFAQWMTWVSAVLVLVSVYVVKYVPKLGDLLIKIKPYFRAVIVGGAVLLLLIFKANITESNVSWGFILSNLLFEVLKYTGLLQKSPPVLIKEETDIQYLEKMG
jgi:hypothetical protein